MLSIAIWSDIACPWCSVGRVRLLKALAQFEHASKVQIVWKAFELDRTLPPVVDMSESSYAGRLARKYRVPPSQAAQMIDRMTATAAADGLSFRFDIIKPGNTFNAHRVLHLPASRSDFGLQDAVKARFLRGYLEEGRAIGDPAEILSMAVEAGLDAGEVREVLESDRFAADVRAEEDEALDLGISGVPYFVLFDRFAISGAQDEDTMLRALRRAWQKLELEGVVSAESCGPDGCALPAK
eukprot:Amastigsp_a514900_15.p1 type:complete len:240 gc:universal Amastigsp_a514900_15:992-273(-)